MPGKGRRRDHARAILHKRKMQNADLTIKKAEVKVPKNSYEKADELSDELSKEIIEETVEKEPKEDTEEKEK